MSTQPEDADYQLDDELNEDLTDPEDGRDGTPYEGSSDSPESMNQIDPLRKHNYLYDDISSEELEDEETVAWLEENDSKTQSE
ncbi:hypothetical protein [Micrococcoides hystricis]|uniref:DUF5709 domain-containing protein n=1 Tax=Micrococcoides hystricis TaxID=1572761 RepID=A0ABV6PDZ9_9MICC